MKIVKCFGRLIAASVVATLILSLILSVYNMVPQRVENQFHNTDYCWEPNSIWLSMVEGISYGKYDANGFNNLEVVDNPDVLIVGSSHMDAAQVPQKQSTFYYLSQMLEDRLTVYNMGTAGHTFAKLCDYLPKSLEAYKKVPKYILIETYSTVVSDTDANNILNHTVNKTPVSNNRILKLLDRVPFFHVIFYQLDGGLIKKLSDDGAEYPSAKQDSDNIDSKKTEIDKAPYDEVFGYLEALQKEYNTQIVIFYHPTEEFNADGTVTFTHNDTYDTFFESAIEHNIAFVDTTAEFEDMYARDHSVPHGFITGKIGEGHLNPDGHYAVAKSLYQAIAQMEEAEDANH